MTESIKVQTTVEVSYDRIADMFVGAIEGGSTYWCYRFHRKTHKDWDGESPWYAGGAFWQLPDIRIEVKHDAVDNAHDDGEGTWITEITNEHVARGLQLMAEKSPSHFLDLVQENDDATTADVFFQYVVLGEVVFG